MSILNCDVIQFPEVDTEAQSSIFFFTITTGDAQGLEESLTIPCSRISAPVPAYGLPDSDDDKADG